MKNKSTADAAPAQGGRNIRAVCFRTQMCGGGTAYDVYFRVKDKPSRPLHCGHYYATEIGRDSGVFYSVVDAIDPKEHWEMEPGSDKWDFFKRLEKVASRLSLRLAKRAFPELLGLRELPRLWAPWSLESKSVDIPVKIQLPE